MEYENIEAGTEIPPLTLEVSIIHTAMYCAVTWDFARQHYDREYARGLGYQQPVIDPQMYGAYAARMLTEWSSPTGRLKKLKLRYRGPGFVGDTITYKGHVSEKYIRGGESFLECQLTVENQEARILVNGTALLSLSTQPTTALR